MNGEILSSVPARSLSTAELVQDIPTFDETELARFRALNVADEGEDVLALETRLAELGYLDSEIEPGTVYSEATEAAVRNFQKINSLEETGTADPWTQALLFSLYALDSEGNAAQTAGTPAVPQPTEQPSETQASTAGAYIGNKNTKKFHRSDCSSVTQMKDSNKVPFDTREEAINQGYEPCKVCNP